MKYVFEFNCSYWIWNNFKIRDQYLPLNGPTKCERLITDLTPINTLKKKKDLTLK